MVTPTESMDIVARAIDESGLLPDEMSYLLHEADTDGGDAGVTMPMVEIQPVTAEHANPNNTDLTDYVVDDEGNRVGEVYYAEYELELEIDVWTSEDGRYDVDKLGNSLREALYEYSSYGPQKSFTDTDGNTVDSIFRFNIGSGERQDDLLQTPTVRRWRHTIEVWGFEEFKTTEEYIVDVDAPASGEETTDADGVIDV